MKKYLDTSGVTHLYKALIQELPIAISSNKLNELFPLKNEYLTFEALEDGTFSFSKTGNPAGSVSYSLNDGVTWTTLGADSSTPTVAAGSKVLWKGNYKGTSESDCGSFSSTGKFNTSGNVMSLMYGDDFRDKVDLAGSNYCFVGLFAGCANLINTSDLALPATTLADYCYGAMFQGCTSLVTAPELPATTLAEGCYFYMFLGCSSLTTGPVLPATTLALYCYNAMFFGCTSLTTSPELSATALAGGCYSQMFANCTSLTTAPELPATTLVDNCYSGMFYSCTSLTIAPELPATTLASGCYDSMFKECRYITTSPELPATTLVDNCYSGMFQNCTNLNYIKALFTTTPRNSYTYNWVDGVSSTGTFVKNAAATWDVTGVNGVPNGWDVIQSN